MVLSCKKKVVIFQIIMRTKLLVSKVTCYHGETWVLLLPNILIQIGEKIRFSEYWIFFTFVASVPVPIAIIYITEVGPLIYLPIFSEAKEGQLIVVRGPCLHYITTDWALS